MVNYFISNFVFLFNAPTGIHNSTNSRNHFNFGLGIFVYWGHSDISDHIRVGMETYITREGIPGDALGVIETGNTR